MNRILCLALFVGLFNFNAFADDDKNHQHHEDLTEAQLGTVHFPTACSASVQHPFERGVALLHSFWYEEAEKEFLEVAKNDPHCAMAHWGVAMSLWHQLWNEPDAKVIARGLSESEKAAAPASIPSLVPAQPLRLTPITRPKYLRTNALTSLRSLRSTATPPNSIMRPAPRPTQMP